jgi:hypothetical protein
MGVVKEPEAATLVTTVTTEVSANAHPAPAQETAPKSAVAPAVTVTAAAPNALIEGVIVNAKHMKLVHNC